jgi:DNA-binding NarL/FixJ family response regulator
MPSKKIMVVEDQTLISESIQHSLKKLGYDVAGHASTGEQAVELARRTSPDLVLMDINLPGKLDGIEAAREIRGELSIPVVYLTGYTDPATVQRAQISAPYGYIVKPFAERELEITISIALYRQQIDKERDRLLVDLQHALAQVKCLSGMLPICCRCKRIRDDRGYWQQIEVYVREHSEADFTHGYCPECAKGVLEESSGDSRY